MLDFDATGPYTLTVEATDGTTAGSQTVVISAAATVVPTVIPPPEEIVPPTDPPPIQPEPVAPVETIVPVVETDPPTLSEPPTLPGSDPEPQRTASDDTPFDGLLESLPVLPSALDGGSPTIRPLPFAENVPIIPAAMEPNAVAGPATAMHNQTLQSYDVLEAAKGTAQKSQQTTNVVGLTSAAEPEAKFHDRGQRKAPVSFLSQIRSRIQQALSFRQASEHAFTQLRESLDLFEKESANEKRRGKAVVGSAIAASTGIAVGYVVWLIRSGMLLTSMLSSMPAWRIADPLVVLSGKQDEEDKDGDESLTTIIRDDSDEKDAPVSSPANGSVP
jgi:hypothetical protein